MENRQLVIRGQLISYFVIEPAASLLPTLSSPTLVFLHGWGSQKEIWESFAPFFPNARIIAFDAPGFGQSPKPADSAWEMSDYARLLADFLTKLKLENVVLAAHSFGGRVAIKFLGGESPEKQRVKKVFLIAPAGFASRSLKIKFLNFFARLAAPLAKNPILSLLIKRLASQLGSTDYRSAGPMRETLKKILAEDLSRDMRNLTTPTVIIAGAKDTEVPFFLIRKMANLINNSQLCLIPNAGHFVFLDKPEETAKIINDNLI